LNSLASRLRDGTTTSTAIVEDCLARIEAREPTVGAWQHLDREAALAQAARRDGVAPKSRLHGIPIALKDIMDTADMPTTYGSPIYAGHRPTEDAICVQRLRAAGAVILGKAVTTQFAHRTPGKTAGGCTRLCRR
jgi:amidase